MSIVEIKNMSFSYNGNSKVLNNINIKIDEKDFVCVVGENGSGKTSLVKCILGLNTGYEGEILLKEKVGYLPQITEIQNNFPASIEEVVLSGTIANNPKKIWYSKQDKEKAINVMKDLDIYEIRRRCFRELSRWTKAKSFNSESFMYK